MSIFKRINILISGLFNSIVSNQEENRTKSLVEGKIVEYQKKMKKINQAICNLLFEQKKFTRKHEELTHKIKTTMLNIEELVKNGKDDVAINLIAKLEHMKEESDFIIGQIEQIKKDIEEGRKTENELKKKIGGSGEQLRLIGGRIEALKVRKSLQQDLSAMSNEVKSWNSENSIQKLQDQMMKLEIELEVQKESDAIKSEVEIVEKSQKKLKYQEYLSEVKNKLGIPREVYGQVIAKA